MGAAESAPVVGLRNDFGTSCYLNALLQVRRWWRPRGATSRLRPQCLASSSRVTVAAGELAVLQENLFSRSLARVLHLLQPCNRGRDRDEVHERVMELQKQSASRIAYCVHQEVCSAAVAVPTVTPARVNARFHCVARTTAAGCARAVPAGRLSHAAARRDRALAAGAGRQGARHAGAAARVHGELEQGAPARGSASSLRARSPGSIDCS